MKSDIQLRAESLSDKFKLVGRKPVVIEFAGVPKAGKTSTLGQLYSFLKRCGYRVEVVVERASMCPIRDKKHTNFNIWTACTTLAQILEKTQTPPKDDDPDVLILDRGLFDSICWLSMMERLSRIRSDDLEIIDRFLRLDDWRRRITVVFVMTASPRESLEREKGFLPVVGATGSIMNVEVLEQMLQITLSAVKRLSKEFKIHTIDTSSEEYCNNPKHTAENTANIVLDSIEELLKEDVYCISKQKVMEVFSGKTSIKYPNSNQLTSTFFEYGSFHAREDIEKSEEYVQALPVVVVRNKSGHILLLRRRETSDSNPLHQKLVIWAGGHVRIEDGKNGEALLRCALRELYEELRLSVEQNELVPLGSIYISKGEKTKKHVAIVYEWRAQTDDVAVALSSTEFYERRGTSLSGKFVCLEDIIKDVKDNKIEEVWSREIVIEFLAPDSGEFYPRLF